MASAPFDIEAAIRQLSDTEAERAFVTISIANRIARKLPTGQPAANTSAAALYEWYSDPGTKVSDRAAALPDDLALRLADAVLRVAAQQPHLIPALAEAVAEQANDDRAALRETLGRAAAVSLILLAATTGFDVQVHRSPTEAVDARVHVERHAMSDEALRALIADLAKVIGVTGK